MLSQVQAILSSLLFAKITKATASTAVNGLVLAAEPDAQNTASRIAGLAIYGFNSDAGLVVKTSNYTITRSYFGVDPDAPLANNGNNVGILLAGGSSSNTIGGPAVADRVFVSANIEAGIKKLKGLLDKFQVVDLALAAYNAGEGAVQKFNGIPPYRETQNYVTRILSIAGLR